MSIPVLVLIPVEEKDRLRFQAALPQGVFTFKEGAPTAQELAAAQVIIGNPPLSRLGEAACLQWLQLGSAGANGYVDPGMLGEEVRLTNATGAYGLAIAEYMLAVLLSMMKRLPCYQRSQQLCRWQDEGPVTSIYGSTTLVLGLGDIGSEFALRMKALGSHVIGVRRSLPDRLADCVDEMGTMDQLEELLGRADIVAMSLPGTPATYRLMDAQKLAWMKPGAYLINVGRGTSVDSDALNQALLTGHLGGAALDVTDPEPLPADHPLWQREKALITPHVSGGYHLDLTYRRILDIVVENLARYARGEALKNQVDRTTGYRKSGE